VLPQAAAAALLLLLRVLLRVGAKAAPAGRLQLLVVQLAKLLQSCQVVELLLRVGQATSHRL
jgi:hypothetical protein